MTQSLQRGDPAGTVWLPAEADTSIRPGWFYHPAEDAKVRSVDNLYDLYFKSVGRNAKLLLNVPPNRARDCCTDVDVANLVAVSGIDLTNACVKVRLRRGVKYFMAEALVIASAQSFRYQVRQAAEQFLHFVLSEEH